MADPFRHVRAGDPFRLSATAWNAALDAAKAERLRSGLGGPIVGGASRSGWVVRVANETGGDLPRNAVVGLGSPVVTPGDDPDAFLRGGVTFRGVVPTSAHRDRFAVLLEPVPAGQVGRAYAAGVYQVMVDVTDEGHSCAAAEAGNTDALVSAETGPVGILWREGESEPYGYGAGLQWAVVRRAAGCKPSEEDDGTIPVECCPNMLPETLEFEWRRLDSSGNPIMTGNPPRGATGTLEHIGGSPDQWYGTGTEVFDGTVEVWFRPCGSPPLTWHGTTKIGIDTRQYAYNSGDLCLTTPGSSVIIWHITGVLDGFGDYWLKITRPAPPP